MNVSKSEWVERAARAGYLTKGILYVLLGALSVVAAWRGGGASGSTDAIKTIGDQPFGQILLVLVGVGLGAYAVWKGIQAVWDTENKGTGAKGTFTRAGYIASSVLHLSLALTALQMALGSGGESANKSWLSQLLASNVGPALLLGAGVGVIAFGLAQVKHAYDASYRRSLKTSQMNEAEKRSIDMSARVGLYARGLVMGIIGYALVRSGLSENPVFVKGVGGALNEIAASTAGPFGLAVVAIGLAAYGLYLIASAKYRQVDC